QSLDETYPAAPAYRVLYLLHGMFGDETSWLRRTNIERYTQGMHLAVVMPYGENSYYTDMAHGVDYFTYLTEELPRFVRASFPVSWRPADTWIAGLSMGGYGACKAALTYPERFAGFACLSGALDIPVLLQKTKDLAMERLMRNIFGSHLDAFAGSAYDVYEMARRAVAQGKCVPPVYIACGRQDTVCSAMNARMAENLQALGVPVTYVERSGAHDWAFWDAEIQEVLRWLPAQGKR
ncbi:MAG: alpha/beta hydrolase family protein, partial [Clostridia bacterium]